MSTLPTRTMIDIHVHLVPGVDDGAQNMEMALEMMGMAKRQGVCQIIATPHSSAFCHSKEGGRIIFKRLADAAAAAYPDMKLWLGCEVYCEAGHMEQVLQALDERRYPTMNGTEYVLMEFPQWVRPERTVPCVEAIVNGGYKPIIAHMERYPLLQDRMDLVDQFRALGAMIQVNAYSLLDEKDAAIRGWARRLVTERKADFLGFDAHRTDHRPPCSEKGLNWLYENLEQEYAEAIAWGNAQRLLCQEPGVAAGKGSHRAEWYTI